MNKTLAALLLLALACVGGLKWHADNLAAQLANVKQKNGKLSAAVSALNASFSTLQKTTNDIAGQEKNLRMELGNAHRLGLTREQKIKRLLNENQVLRDWFNTALPADVARLHQRPAFSGTADYLRWLSESHPVPDTGQPAAY